MQLSKVVSVQASVRGHLQAVFSSKFSDCGFSGCFPCSIWRICFEVCSDRFLFDSRLFQSRFSDCFPCSRSRLVSRSSRLGFCSSQHSDQGFVSRVFVRGFSVRGFRSRRDGFQIVVKFARVFQIKVCSEMGSRSWTVFVRVKAVFRGFVRVLRGSWFGVVVSGSRGCRFLVGVREIVFRVVVVRGLALEVREVVFQVVVVRGLVLEVVGRG